MSSTFNKLVEQCLSCFHFKVIFTNGDNSRNQVNVCLTRSLADKCELGLSESLLVIVPIMRSSLYSTQGG